MPIFAKGNNPVNSIFCIDLSLHRITPERRIQGNYPALLHLRFEYGFEIDGKDQRARQSTTFPGRGFRTTVGRNGIVGRECTAMGVGLAGPEGRSGSWRAFMPQLLGKLVKRCALARGRETIARQSRFRRRTPRRISIVRKCRLLQEPAIEIPCCLLAWMGAGIAR